jgi:hypothetical protein
MFSSSTFPRIVGAFLSGTVLLLTGCETTKSAPELKKSEALTEPFAVKRGTLSAELIANLGEPDEIAPLADYSVEAMVWVYKRKIGAQSRMVLAGTRDVRYYDPATEQTISIPEPIMAPEVTHTHEITKIIVVRDRVVSWSRSTSQDRDIEGLSR